MNVVHKEALCINCGCCVSECNAMESDPEFLGPQALAKGFRFVGDPRDGRKSSSASRSYNNEHGIWECTRCYFCNERCPKGVDPRDAIAKLGAESVKAGHHSRHGRQARELVRALGEDDGLAPRDGAHPEDAGRVSTIKQMKFAMSLMSHGKARPIPFPPHVAADVDEARQLRSLVREQGVDGALGIVQGEHALAALGHGFEPDRDPYDREDAFPRPFLPDENGGTRAERRTRARRESRAPSRLSTTEVPQRTKVAYYKGCLASLSAKELDSSTQALAPKVELELIELESVTCCGAGDIHEAEPDYYLHLNARILAYAQATGADTLMTICNVCTLNLRQANHQLRLDDALRARVNANLAVGRRPAVRAARST